MIAFLAAATLGVLPPGPVRAVAMPRTSLICCVQNSRPGFGGAAQSLECEPTEPGGLVELELRSTGNCSFIACVAVSPELKVSPWTNWHWRAPE